MFTQLSIIPYETKHNFKTAMKLYKNRKYKTKFSHKEVKVIIPVS